MQWKAHFFLNGNNKENDTKTSFGFKSRHHSPWWTQLEHFKNDVINITDNVQLTNNHFQEKLGTDITEIKNSSSIYVFSADKTYYIYRMQTSEHNKR